MPHQKPARLLNLFGLVIWGDFGPTTLYRDHRRRLVSFAKTWPAKPPTDAQQTQRDALTATAAAWQALTPAQRAEWNTAARRASLYMHGYDLFVHWSLTGDDTAMQTLERQTNTDLIP